MDSFKDYFEAVEFSQHLRVVFAKIGLYIGKMAFFGPENCIKVQKCEDWKHFDDSFGFVARS